MERVEAKNVCLCIVVIQRQDTVTELTVFNGISNQSYSQYFYLICFISPVV